MALANKPNPSGHCIQREPEEGMVAVDAAKLDAIFRVVDVSDSMEPSKLICGDSVGKAPDAHAVDVLQVDQVLYVGGSLPPEIILSLPTFTFSYADLKCLAAASKSMLRTIRSGESWKGLYLNVDCEELNCPQRLRCMENLWRSAGGVLFSLKQLAMLIDWPERTFIKFTTVSGQVPRPGGRLLHSFFLRAAAPGHGKHGAHPSERSVRDVHGRGESESQVKFVVPRRQYLH